LFILSVKENPYEIHLSTFIEENEVRSIVLSDKLAAKAKKSGIKEYLNGNRIVIVQDVKPSKAVAELPRATLRARSPAGSRASVSLAPQSQE
jgi:hypothetical protein